MQTLNPLHGIKPMFKLLAYVALMVCSYVLLVTYAPPAIMLGGFMLGATWIAWWWCGFALYGVVAWRAIF
jgi:hypothetical protein